MKKAEIVLAMELESKGVANEKVLNDKELDGKEERDTLDKVSTPAPGKKMGLDHRIAEEYVSSFCKVNGVRRNSDVKKWAVPVAVVAVLALGLIGFYLAAKPKTETVTQTVIETKVVDTNTVVLTDKDRIEIDDQLRRAVQFVEKAQYTDPPEKSAKASLDQIKQIDPNGQCRGDEVKGLSSKIVDHYINLAEKSAASDDKASAGKWLDRAKLMNTDREVIIEKEKALGLATTGEQ